jgi:hypothetical protein
MFSFNGSVKGGTWVYKSDKDGKFFCFGKEMALGCSDGNGGVDATSVTELSASKLL